MVLINKVIITLISAISKFTLAVVNFNIDFSLFKFEALDIDAKKNIL